MADFTGGWKIIPKNGTIFFYGKKNINGIQSACRYQLRVSRCPHNISLGHVLVEIV